MGCGHRSRGLVVALCRSSGRLAGQWLASRLLAIAKAKTANAVSLPHVAFSTAILYAGARPGGWLYGAAWACPADPASLYAGAVADYGTPRDARGGQKASGLIVFGGGPALDDGRTILGALGVSGDTSCADHTVAWCVPAALGFGKVPAGIATAKNDAIIYIYDLGLTGHSSSGYGHPRSGLQVDDGAKEIGATANGA